MSTSEAWSLPMRAGAHRRMAVALGLAIALHLGLVLVWDDAAPEPKPSPVISLSLMAPAPIGETAPQTEREQSEDAEVPTQPIEPPLPEPIMTTTMAQIEAPSIAPKPAPRTPIDLDQAREQVLRDILDAPAEPERRNARRLYTSGDNSIGDQYYLDAWTRELMRVGRLNYPQRAREEGITGSLRLLVAIADDGQLAGVRIVASSGHEVLDTAALRIIRLAAPYVPPPKEMLGDAEVLEIVHTWQFARRRPGG